MTTRLLIFLLLALSAGSCNFLDEEPRDFLSPANFYKTEKDAVAGVDAIYSSLTATWNLGDLASDLLNEGAAPRTENLELQTFTFSSANPHFANFWQNNYVGINRANTALNRIPSIEMNEDRKARLLSEARFLRALFYFDLVKVFGDVPLLTTETEGLQGLTVARNTSAEVYQQIIRDLEEAQAVLPATYATADNGRATKGAALSLLAKVYLFNQQFDKAAEKARQVSTMSYNLVANYADLWPSDKENGPEHIFSIQYKAGIKGSGFNETFGVRGGKAPITGGSGAFVKRSFFDSFEPGDIRKAVSIKTSYTFTDGSVQNFEPHVWKYFNPNGITPSNTDTNWPVLRLADVLLILAEAISEQKGGPDQEAYDAINKVRTRAKLPALKTGMTLQEFRDAVLKERGWELCFEGHRRYDLVRMNKLAEAMQKAGVTVTVPQHNLFPIPLREMDVNDRLQQNPGY